MKTLYTYITEAIKHLPKSVSGIIVFDIDDTLLKVNKIFALLMPLFMLVVYFAQIAIYGIAVPIILGV